MSLALPLVVLLQAAPLPADEPPARRAGWYSEIALGVASGSAPTTPSELSFTGFLARAYFNVTFPLGERWRLGPAFGSAISSTSLVTTEGDQSATIFVQLSGAAQLEIALGDLWSLGLAPGLGFAMVSGPSVVGPEFGVSLRQRRPLWGSDLACGTVFRFSVMPWLATGTPTTGPGFSWMATMGFGLGVGDRPPTPFSWSPPPEE